MQTLQGQSVAFIGKEAAAEIDHVFKNLDSFIKHFPGEFNPVGDLQKSMEQQVLQIVFKHVNDFKAQKSMDQLVQSMIEIKCLTEVVSIWKIKIDKSIDTLLDEVPSLKYQGGAVNIENLYVALEQHESPCAR